ncbi:Hypothetical predicted protein [Xyrichtys novacula]|uniref:Uncharacterized protein n=1 Tax=Xyrichtys novacula TaxID=13765 RepID=A0AAV1EZL7_XYRNO|nr:Hypothetical predicted protein [Xyrichtys novacula]
MGVIWVCVEEMEQWVAAERDLTQSWKTFFSCPLSVLGRPWIHKASGPPRAIVPGHRTVNLAGSETRLWSGPAVRTPLCVETERQRHKQSLNFERHFDSSRMMLETLPPVYLLQDEELDCRP